MLFIIVLVLQYTEIDHDIRMHVQFSVCCVHLDYFMFFQGFKVDIVLAGVVLQISVCVEARSSVSLIKYLVLQQELSGAMTEELSEKRAYKLAD